MTKYQIEIDIVSDYPISDFLSSLNNAQIISYNANGPAANNPCLTLSFDTHHDALKYLIDNGYDQDAHDIIAI